jgi:hypothetical protein
VRSGKAVLILEAMSAMYMGISTMSIKRLFNDIKIQKKQEYLVYTDIKIYGVRVADRHKATRRRQGKTVMNYGSYCTEEKGVGHPYEPSGHTPKRRQVRG